VVRMWSTSSLEVRALITLQTDYGSIKLAVRFWASPSSPYESTGWLLILVCSKDAEQFGFDTEYEGAIVGSLAHRGQPQTGGARYHFGECNPAMSALDAFSARSSLALSASRGLSLPALSLLVSPCQASPCLGSLFPSGVLPSAAVAYVHYLQFHGPVPARSCWSAA